MTAFMCSLFYIYTVYAINYYRREIIIRIENDIYVPFEPKAPLTAKTAVLCCIIAVLINVLLQLIIGNDMLILLNVCPVLWFMLVLRRYEKKIIKIDRTE